MVTNGISLIILMFTAYVLGAKNSSEKNRLAGHITATVGCGFSRRYPRYIFGGSHWDVDERYKVSLRTNDNKALFSNTWISLDPTGQKIIGFPLNGNEGQFKFLLRAVNRAGKMKSRKIQVDVLRQKFASVHKVTMKFSHGFREFIQNLNHRIFFASIISKYLRQNGIAARMNDIWITSIETQELTISWALSTYNGNSCSEVLTKQLPELLLKGSKPHPVLLQMLGPHFSISLLSYATDFCARPRQMFKPSQQRNLIIGPVLIIVIMIGLSSPIFVAYLIRRGRRKREFRRAADVRHVYSNGFATLIVAEPEGSSLTYNSHEDMSTHRLQYRWSPDMTNRIPIQIPSCPPPKPAKILADAAAKYTSLEGDKSTAWHGLPNNQCTESDSIQLANIVSTISQSATTLKSYFMAGNEKDSGVNGTVQAATDDDSFSITSEGGKIFESAVRKLSSVINTSYFSAPTLIRISGSDNDENGSTTRRSSVETRNSSFEQSSDQPTSSLISSDVTSCDTETQMLMTSFSQDDSFSEDLSMYSKEEENGHDKDETKNTKAIVRKAPSSQRWSVSKSTLGSLNKSRETQNEKDIEREKEPCPVMKNHICGSLQRAPQVKIQGNILADNIADKSDFFHPLHREQAVQLNVEGSASHCCVSKVAKVGKTAQRKILPKDVIYECCYDEGF